MNPFLTTVIVKGILRRTRVCPKCRRSQVVSSNRKKDTVACKFCGADIPPNKTKG